MLIPTRLREWWLKRLRLGNGQVVITGGLGAPEGVQVGWPGWVWYRSDPPDVNNWIYVKLTGNGTNTGWSVK